MLKPLSLDKDTKKELQTPIDPRLIRTRKQSKKNNVTLSYLNGYTVVSKLNDIFGYNWNFEIRDFWLEDNLICIKNESKWVTSGKTAHCIGVLTVRTTNDDGDVIEIVKEAFGTKPVTGGATDTQFMYKAASTDALKKCASLLGIGASLYMTEEETEAFAEIYAVDLWDDEAKERYKEDLAKLEAIKSKYGLRKNDLDQLVFDFTKQTVARIDFLEPELLPDFIHYLEELTKEGE